MMDINIKNTVEINFQKINYKVMGVSLVKISINDDGEIVDHYAMTPSNRNYINDISFLNNILLKIEDEIIKKNKTSVLNFSQGFPLLEMLSYRAEKIDSLRNIEIRDEIAILSKKLSDNNITLGKQYPLKDQRKYNEGNSIFIDFKNNNKNSTSPLSFNNIIYSNRYITKKEKRKQPNLLNIVKHIDDEGIKSYLLSYQDESSTTSRTKIFQFENIIEENLFFKNLFADLNEKEKNTIIYNNDHELSKNKNKEHNKIIMRKSDPSNSILTIMNDKKIVEYYKNKNAELPFLNFTELNLHINNEKKIKKEDHKYSLASFRNGKLFDIFKENTESKGISHILMKRIADKENENIFVTVVEQEKKQDDEFVTKFFNFSIDLQSNNDDDVIFSKFSQIFENKLGYSIEHSKANKSQIFLHNFEDRGVLAWKIRNGFNTNIVNIGWENNIAYASVLNNYIENNIENMIQKNRLMADDGPTDENTLCIYSDASVYRKYNNAITYGAVVRAPNSDKIIKEISGIKKIHHQEDPNIAEEIGIIETLKSLKMLIEQGSLSFNKNIEIRCDNIDVIENFYNKNGKDNNITELYSSEIYSKKEVNEILSFFDNINFKWIKGHCNDVYNEKADNIARRSWNLINSKGFINYGHKKICDDKISDDKYQELIAITEMSNANNDQNNKHKNKKNQRRRNR